MKLLVKVNTIDIIEGIREAAAACPIALRIKKMGFMPIVSTRRVGLYPINAKICSILSTQLPQEAEQFVRDFDAGKKVDPIEFELEFEDWDLSNYKRMGSNG